VNTTGCEGAANNDDDAMVDSELDTYTVTLVQ